jgi:hypothetical protein
MLKPHQTIVSAGVEFVFANDPRLAWNTSVLERKCRAVPQGWSGEAMCRYHEGVTQTDYRHTFEVVVKVLSGTVVAIAAIWFVGWLLRAVGVLMLTVSGFLIELLKFLIPVVVLAALVYWIMDRLRSARD